MKLPILYSRASTGKVQEWEIEVEDNKYRTIAGQQGGKKTVSKWTEAKGKNIGRSNETTDAEQAALEAKAKWQKKFDGKYSTDLDKIDSDAPFKPMLADKWEKRKDKVEYVVYGQPKLDGVRCISKPDGLYTRTGKPIVAVPHIQEQMKLLHEKHPGTIFDGELYNHQLKEDFNKLISLIRKTKPSEEAIEESADVVQYWIYDCTTGNGDTYLERLSKLMLVEKDYKDGSYENSIRFVDTTVIANEEELDIHYGQVMQEGYEGQIIRINGPYENKRSKLLLKRKEFSDQEYEIVEIVEGKGNRSGMAGRITFKDKDGNEFGSGIKGGETWYKQLWTNKDNLVGQMATVRYFELTPDGVPRFPVCVAVRDYE